MKSLKIQQVSNGFIVRVINTGDSLFKEPFTKPVSVFLTLTGLEEFLASFFITKKEK